MKKYPVFQVAKEGLEPLTLPANEIIKMITEGQIDGETLLYNNELLKWTKVRNTKGFRTLIKRMSSTEDIVSNISEPNPTTQVSIISLQNVTSTKEGKFKDLVKASELDTGKGPHKYSMYPQKSSGFQFEKKQSFIFFLRYVTIAIISLAFICLLYLYFWHSGISNLNIVSITGTATHSGKIIKCGAISFEDPDNPESFYYAPIIDSSFRLQAAIQSGKNQKVRIYAFKNLERKELLNILSANKILHPVTLGSLGQNYIPDKYNKNSILLESISDNKIICLDFNLESTSKTK